MHKKIPIWISNRHVHLSAADAVILFGPDYVCQRMRDLSQPGQFVCAETISLKWPKGQIDGVRVLGPYRTQTQVEILQADNFKLGTQAPIRMSGDLQESSPITIIGLCGSVELDFGMIVAQRHLHATPQDAHDLWLHDGQIVSVALWGERALVFGAIVVRISSQAALDMHIDVEEWNAAGLVTCAYGELLQ